jgi:amino acid efflux transporter
LTVRSTKSERTSLTWGSLSSGALAVVVVLYLGLAVATVGVLGTPSSVPLADLMDAGLGAPGRTVTAGLAVLLTMGPMNTYVAASTRLAGTLVEGARPVRALTVFALVAAVVLALLAAGALGLDGLMRAVSALFVAVYVTATAAGFRLLRGAPRTAAGVSFAAVLVVFAFSGPYLLAPLGLSLAVVALTTRRHHSRNGVRRTIRATSAVVAGHAEPGVRHAVGGGQPGLQPRGEARA